MEVVLKKSKITNSVMKQTLIKQVFFLMNLKPLGWCIWQNSRFFVFYDEDKKLLYKCPNIQDIEILKDWRHINDALEIEYFYKVKISFVGNFSTEYVEFISEKDANNFKENIQILKDNFLKIGQFYI